MGRLKNLGIEMEQFDWEPTQVSFTCPKCREETEADTELPVTYEGAEWDYFPITLQCVSCNEVFDATGSGSWDSVNVELDDHPEISVDAEPIRGFIQEPDLDYEYFSDPNFLLLHPGAVFSMTMVGVTKILDSGSFWLAKDTSDLLLRMLLVQTVSALEGYLSDTLIKSVEASQDAQRRILESKQLGLRDKTVNLTKTFGVENYAKKEILIYLRNSLFHNLPLAKLLYQLALQIDITPDETELKVLNDAILIRHDCVHRNGKRKDGESYHELSPELIKNISDAASSLVWRVEEIIYPS